MLIEIDHFIGERSVGIRVTAQNHHLQAQINGLPEHAPDRFKAGWITVCERIVEQNRKTAVMGIAQGLGN